MRKALGAVLLMLIAAALAGCAGGLASGTGTVSGRNAITVFAASSLKEAFTRIGDDLKAKGMVSDVTFNFAGSQALATQLSQGARADVFAPADRLNMDAAVASGAVGAEAARPLLTNRLVVVAPKDGSVRSLHDLARPGLKLVLAAPSVPAGNYSVQALENLSAAPEYGADFDDRVLANVVSREENVRQVLAKVALGEADAGIVYATDADNGDVTTIPIPDAYNVVARYYVAPTLNAPNPEGARRFVAYVLSPEGQAVLAEYGFGPAEGE
ncbi:MAG TPA: molybdate ABC transporter substrate-binding protein [Chloroflexia bacterium]|nr:molybdate ABC transporter substrate-binding protein [Chloroflexia bacterium]